MKPEDVAALVQYRLEQARTAAGDTEYLLDGKRSAQSIVNRSYYAMFYATLDLLQQRGTIPSKQH